MSFFVKLYELARHQSCALQNTQVRANCRLVLVTKPLVHILVHEGGLLDTAVAENYDLEQYAAHNEEAEKVILK